MSDLVLQRTFGDITFGIPGDIKLLHKPFGFYEFLGIARTTSREEIKKAYKRLARELHPDISKEEDKLKNEEGFKCLQTVVDTLLDDTKELGEEHSRRRHYDEVSSLDSHFDGFISYKNERTKKLSEIMLIRMQMKRRVSEIEQDIAKKHPEFLELKAKLARARSEESKEKIVEQLQRLVMDAAEITQEIKEKIDKVRKEASQEYDRKQKQFLDRFCTSQGNNSLPKILDIFYLGGEAHNKVIFGTEHRRIHFGLAGHEEQKHILEMVLAGDCYLTGFPQVHFKAPEAQVEIIDPHLTGIFHVITGTVRVDYKNSSYAEVIRVRAPSVENLQGFIEREGLYVPEKFATKNWWRKKPALDISVREGSVQLRLRSPVVSAGYVQYGLLLSQDFFIKEKDSLNFNKKIY